MRSVSLSRRQTMAGVAWAVPTVVLANAAPAYAASPSLADLVIDFDHSEWGQAAQWGPGRFYVCTQVSNNSSQATTAPVVVTLTTPAGVSGTFPTPYGKTAWPAGWKKDGEGTNVLTVTIPGPIAAQESFHVSYWWTTDADTHDVACVAGVSGGGEASALSGNNTSTSTVSRPALTKVGAWMGDAGSGSLAAGTARIYYGLANGSSETTTSDLVMNLDRDPAFTGVRIIRSHPAWRLDLAGSVTATYLGRLAPDTATPTFEIEWIATEPLTESYYAFRSDVGGADRVQVNVTNS